MRTLDSITEQITQILSDPGSMQQIMQIASAFGTSSDTTSQEPIHDTIAAGLSQAFQEVRKKEEKQQALVHALLPYLRPSHKRKLERAIQAARLSQLAGTALRNEVQSATEREGTHDV